MLREVHARSVPTVGFSDAETEAPVVRRRSKSGRLFGVGLGPGDPELLTLKALKALSTADAVAFFTKKGHPGQAYTIAAPYLRGQQEVVLTYPFTTELSCRDQSYLDAMQAFYADCAHKLRSLLQVGKDVALICEGDPLFYGSFMHLYLRMRHEFESTIIPGVTGMSGCWAAVAEPMTWGDDVMTVIPGTLDQAEMELHLARSNAAVIMKVGGNYPKVRAAIARTNLLNRAYYVERATTGREQIMRLADKSDDEAPYFSIVLVPSVGQTR